MYPSPRMRANLAPTVRSGGEALRRAQEAQGCEQSFNPGARPGCVLAQMPAEEPRAGTSIEEAEGVSGHGVERYTVRQFPLHVIDETIQHGFERAWAGAKKAFVGIEEQCRILIGGPAQHDAIDPLEMGCRGLERGEPAIENYSQCRVFALDRVHERIVERRNLPVFTRRQPLEPGFSRVDNEDARARVGDCGDEIPQARFRVL